MTLQEYYDLHLKKPDEGICPICEKPTKFTNKKGYGKYCSQSCTVKGQWQDPAYRESKIEKTKKQWENPEFVKKTTEAVSARRKEDWQNPEYRDKMTKTG